MPRVVKIIASIAVLASLAGCAETQAPITQAPSPTTLSTQTPLPPSAQLSLSPTPSGPCAIYEGFDYPTPPARTGVAFTSRPDPANHKAVYTGFVAYSGASTGLAVFDGIFITNTGNEPIPVDGQHFTVANQKVNWLPNNGKSVPPNSQRTFSLQTYPRASKVSWTIAGTLDTVEIPYTTPTGAPIVPPDQCR